MGLSAVIMAKSLCGGRERAVGSLVAGAYPVKVLETNELCTVWG